MGKTKVAVIGNCQGPALQQLLSHSRNFKRSFKIEKHAGVHVMGDSDVTRLHDSLPSIGLLIVQSIDHEYRDYIGLGTSELTSRLPGHAEVMTFPSIYWPAYSPELFYLRKADQTKATEEFDYHHRLILRAYLRGLSPDQALQYLTDESAVVIDPDIAQRGIDELHRREQVLDVGISDFIAMNFQTRRLFHTMNHPANDCLAHVARQIFAKLGLGYDIPPGRGKELLGQTSYPILPAVRSSLGLSFNNDFAFRIRNRKMRPRDVVERYFQFYDASPEAVSLNRDEVTTIDFRA